MKGQHVSFLRKKQILTGHIIRNPQGNLKLHIDHWKFTACTNEKNYTCNALQSIQVYYSSVRWNTYWICHFTGMEPYTRQVLQLSSPKANCAFVYACAYVCVCVLGVMRVGRSTGRTIWSLEYCYLLNYKELCITQFPEAFKICWESFLARLFHTIYTTFGHSHKTFQKRTRHSAKPHMMASDKHTLLTYPRFFKSLEPRPKIERITDSPSKPPSNAAWSSNLPGKRWGRLKGYMRNFQAHVKG